MKAVEDTDAPDVIVGNFTIFDTIMPALINPGSMIGVNHACISVKFLCAFKAQLHDSHSYSLILR